MAVDQMSDGTGRRYGTVTAAVAGLVAVMTGLLLAGLPAGAAPLGSAEYLKYYTVTSSYQGAPETLGGISQRFLGTADRSVEIFSLNVGRPQLDGGKLSDPKTLRPGWHLVLPWDAVGSGVQYGLLPQKSANPVASGSAPGSGTGSAPGTGSGTGSAPGSGTGPAAPGQSPSAGAPTNVPVLPRAGNPAVVPSSAPKPTYKKGQCVAAKTSNSPSNWAAQRLTPDQAWAHSRGNGQLVAIVDSGVDGSLEQLAGHVAIGADVVSGSGRGNTDCLSSGTGMAGIIAAQPTKGSPLSGIAPDATVLPVRVVTTRPKAKAADQAAGIEVATSAGATVIALGSYVNMGEAAVAKAIATAVSRNIVVVVGAPTAATPAGPDLADGGGGVLRVGGVGVGGQPAASYRPGAVDVVAPGLNVTTLGVTGTGVLASDGTSYAVAFAAAEAALVRSAYPGLDAAQITHRVKVTADKMSDAVPDNRYGHGMINLVAALTRELPEEQQAVAPADRRTSDSTSGARTMALIIIGVIGLGAAGLLALRVRRLMRPDQDGPASSSAGGTPNQASAGGAAPPAGQAAVDPNGRHRGPSAPADPTKRSAAPRPASTVSE
ncbi:S8 family serine peptidase [Micromonospora sp. RTGN7]|uniref:S8 family serine peptidase n=1 Tax=Micromonospora sp. RTGN7 TaxID=3016526 RepID=UPI0029FEE1C9|nr:S8 family serine peptidase [Micromonospora sp. RTGN7]